MAENTNAVFEPQNTGKISLEVFRGAYMFLQGMR
jgi:hypothetical protein